MSRKNKSNAGRKPSEDKKEQVSIYVHQSVIKEHGGKDKLRKALTDHVYFFSEKKK